MRIEQQKVTMSMLSDGAEIKQLQARKPLFWLNPALKPAAAWSLMKNSINFWSRDVDLNNNHSIRPGRSGRLGG
jgi:hypothetical protein